MEYKPHFSLEYHQTKYESNLTVITDVTVVFVYFEVFGRMGSSFS
jgi:hypothetical protein